MTISSPTANKRAAKKAKPTNAKHSRPSKGGSVEERILHELRELFDIGITSPTRVQIAISCGYKSIKTKSFASAIVKLCKHDGLIEYPSGKTIRLTSAGIERTGGAATLVMTNEDFHAKICNVLQGKEVALFRLLIDGDSYSRQEVAESLGYSSVKTKSFSEAASKLRSLGYLESAPGGMIRLTDQAFPLGRTVASA